jgi:hypothetical protein
MFWLEIGCFKFYNDITSELQVIEEKVHKIFPSRDLDFILPSNRGKTLSKLKKKFLNMFYETLFKLFRKDYARLFRLILEFYSHFRCTMGKI